MTELKTFDDIQSAALECCTADDVRAELSATNVSLRVIEAAVAAEKQARVAEFSEHIMNLLRTKRDILLDQRNQISIELNMLDSVLDDTTIEGNDHTTALPPEVREQLISGLIDMDTFVESMQFLGYTPNLACRVFQRLRRENYGEMFGEIGRTSNDSLLDLLKLTDILCSDNDRNGDHVLLGIHRFGSTMLQATFDLGTLYLEVVEQQTVEDRANET